VFIGANNLTTIGWNELMKHISRKKTAQVV